MKEERKLIFTVITRTMAIYALRFLDTNLFKVLPNPLLNLVDV